MGQNTPPPQDMLVYTDLELLFLFIYIFFCLHCNTWLAYSKISWNIFFVNSWTWLTMTLTRMTSLEINDHCSGQSEFSTFFFTLSFFVLRQTGCSQALWWCNRAHVTRWLMRPLTSTEIGYSTHVPDSQGSSHHANEPDSNLHTSLFQLFLVCLGNQSSVVASVLASQVTS